MKGLEHANGELFPFRMGLQRALRPMTLRGFFNWRKVYVSLQREL